MQILINGVISGCSVALLAIAFQAVYLPTRVFYLGLAGIYCLAPFLVLTGQMMNWPWAICLLFALAVSMMLSILFEWANHARLARKNVGEGVHLISSLGLYIVTVQVVTMIWGTTLEVCGLGLIKSSSLAMLL